ncbi:MAG TPA: cupin domain-containing protein [Cellvibrio sp.]|nr:cupin domain-containing protein [Cellvibrio sp.]
MTSPLTHLGDMPIETFLRDYWQKKPLLIRNAFPQFASPLDGDELAGLALEEEVESRLILEKGKTPWELQHGPFDEKIFAKLPESHWTLLVQAVDQWVPEVNELLNHFRFIPNWRLDDIMISFAPDQGSVGPHFDYYDVFLLQGLGKRRWKIGQHCDVNSARVEGTPLNILQDFIAQDEWLLEQGDMLYIPPGVAHWGVAEGECMTYSIGFRAPSHADILTELSQDIASSLCNDQRFSDPQLTLQANPGEISGAAIAQIQEILQQHFTADNIALWFGKHMTERKYNQDETSGENELDADDWIAAMAGGNMLWRHPAARLAYHSNSEGTVLFADGQAISCSASLAELVCGEVEIDWRTLQPLLEDLYDRAAITQLINQESLLVDE